MCESLFSGLQCIWVAGLGTKNWTKRAALDGLLALLATADASGIPGMPKVVAVATNAIARDQEYLVLGGLQVLVRVVEVPDERLPRIIGSGLYGAKHYTQSTKTEVHNDVELVRAHVARRRL